MRLATLTVLMISNLLANQAHAQDFSSQPLTRADCEKARMTWDESANVCIGREISQQPLTKLDCESVGSAWNDNANVCAVASQAAEALPAFDLAEPTPMPQTANASSQPLTRSQCDLGGMTWNDQANVCEGKAGQATTPSVTKESEAVASTVLINIDKTAQRMTVLLDGVQLYEWPVSTGLRGYTTPSGTYVASSMNRMWYSKQWDNAPMPHAVFFTKRGHAIHGTYDTKRLGRPASHGCVRLAPEHARTLFALVKEKGLMNTQVILSGDTPGGEARVASPALRKQPIKQSKKFAYSEFGRGEPESQRRGQHDSGPRGFYQQY